MLWARQAQSTASLLEVTSEAASSEAIASKCCEHSEHLKNCCTYCLPIRRNTATHQQVSASAHLCKALKRHQTLYQAPHVKLFMPWRAYDSAPDADQKTKETLCAETNPCEHCNAGGHTAYCAHIQVIERISAERVDEAWRYSSTWSQSHLTAVIQKAPPVASGVARTARECSSSQRPHVKPRLFSRLPLQLPHSCTQS